MGNRALKTPHEKSGKVTQSLVCASPNSSAIGRGFHPLPGEGGGGAESLGAPRKQAPRVPVLVELDADSRRMFRLLGALVETGNQCWLWDRPYGRPNCLPHRELM